MNNKNRIPIKIRAFENNCPVCYEQWTYVMPWVLPCGHMICECCHLKQKKVKRLCHICRERYSIRIKRRIKKPKPVDIDITEEEDNYWFGWNGWDR